LPIIFAVVLAAGDPSDRDLVAAGDAVHDRDLQVGHRRAVHLHALLVGLDAASLLVARQVVIDAVRRAQLVDHP